MHESPVPDPTTAAITSIGKSIPTSAWLMRSYPLSVNVLNSLFGTTSSSNPRLVAFANIARIAASELEPRG
jgi:hypothetical protein